jgi:Domain of unknown function (DUF4226)
MAEQSGQSAAAPVTRLSALANQYRAVAAADLQLAEALAEAHTAGVNALERLDRIEAEIDSAVADPGLFAADTGAGARELQRFLIGKQREITAVVAETAERAKLKADAVKELIGLYT